MSIMTSEALEITNIDFVSSEVLRIQYKFAGEFINPSPVTNVGIAPFTTAHARLKLYSYLEELQEQVVYFDRDSDIFKYSPGMYCPPLGYYLGDLTSEHITTFCSTG